MTPDRLAQIINDISEGVNHGNHTRAEYREAIARLQDECTQLRIAISEIESKAVFARVHADINRNRSIK